MTSTFDIDVPTLKARVTNLLKTPKTEWPVIEAEATTTDKLFKSYVVPLAAIPAVASFIGTVVVGHTIAFGVTYRDSLPSAFSNMVVGYVLALAGVYVAALIVNRLAPTFDSKPDEMQALKLVAYAWTPAWIAGVLMIIPALGVLSIIGGIYAIYLFYLGLPVMMKTPEPKIIPYMAVAAVVVIAVMVVISLVSAVLTGIARY